MIKKRVARGVAVVCASALIAAACGSDDEPSAETEASADTEAPDDTEAMAEEPADTDAMEEEPADTDAMEDEPADTDATEDEPADTEAPAEGGLGEPNPATGDPIEVAYIWSGVSPTIDNTDDVETAKTTAQWVNEFKGGIGADGRELVLVDCSTDEDAAVAAACGSEIVDSDTPIVLFNVNGQVEPWATPTLSAGIPVFAFSSADASLLAFPDLVFTMSNPIGGLAEFPATLAAENDIEQTTIVVIDVPGATGPAQALGPAAFEARDAGNVNILPISPSATDHGADIQADIQSTDPGLIHVIGNSSFCSLSFQALREAGYDGMISGISNCVDTAIIEQMGSDLEGIILSYAGNEDPADADYNTLLEILDHYGRDDIFPKGTPTGSYIVVEAFRRFMEDYEGDWSPESLTEYLRNHDPVALVGNPDASYICDGEQVAGVAIACTSSFFYSALDAEGNPTDFVGVD